MNKALVELKNISLLRNDKVIISNMSLSLYNSSVINIFGHNGSGKTSLLKILVGITEPTSGDVINNIEEQQNDISYIGHKYGIKSNLTLNENLLFGYSDTLNKQNAIDEMISKYGMDKYRNYLTKYLSHGQQKKVSLMRANISGAKIWVIDEPYSALDNDTITILDKSIHEHIINDGSVIMTNHKSINNKKYDVNNMQISK
tara:strand:- start:485 stop:1087 length:603 start_codon:yes stop_codon:yes gene_type:complete